MTTRIGHANVYMQIDGEDRLVGTLEQMGGSGRVMFTYADSYLQGDGLALSHTLPKQAAPFEREGGLPPYFDNLVAGGRMADVQREVLDIDEDDRFSLLVAYGHGIGGVSVRGSFSFMRSAPSKSDLVQMAVTRQGGSVPSTNLTVLVRRDSETGELRAVRNGETSTHIAKFPRKDLPDYLPLEYGSNVAFRELLPHDDIAGTSIGHIQGIEEKALIIERFDRTPGGQKIHFEEMAQAMGKSVRERATGSYEDVAAALRQMQEEAGTAYEGRKLFERIVANAIVGNIDLDTKNIAVMRGPQGVTLSPSYDVVAIDHFGGQAGFGLTMAGAKDKLELPKLAAKHFVIMGEAFGLNEDQIEESIRRIGERIPAAARALASDPDVPKSTAASITRLMKRGWNNSFRTTTKYLESRSGMKRKGPNRTGGLILDLPDQEQQPSRHKGPRVKPQPRPVPMPAGMDGAA